VRGQDHPWVSRGGLKLAHALEAFDLDPTGLVCLDLGASTGGFTDVLLQSGAAKVYAVDVGHGQLAWKLRSNPRVVVLERTNARTLSTEQVPELCDLLVCDASFIGLEVLLPAPLALMKEQATLWCFVQAVLGGLTLRAAWLVEAAGTLSLSSGYRLWRRLGAAQSALRARLCREAPAPPSNARDPLAQLCTHLQLVIGGGVADFFSTYQSRFGRGLFDS
jgi:hypothetical protein